MAPELLYILFQKCVYRIPPKTPDPVTEFRPKTQNRSQNPAQNPRPGHRIPPKIPEPVTKFRPGRCPQDSGRRASGPQQSLRTGLRLAKAQLHFGIARGHPGGGGQEGSEQDIFCPPVIATGWV